ncbi:MAG TPA: ABC transporter substrate-binding protein [Spirochaetaceae bacterium]|nr:ABC transporter substrate-binding protein [Spirochaetaceae bacterium]
MKRTIAAIVATMAIVAFASCAKNKSGSTSSKSGTIKIGISKILAHPALDASEQGIKDYLKQKGIDADIDVQNANGDVAVSAQIAQKFKADGKQVVVGIATPTAQALVQTFPASSNVPIVFAAVTDPVEAGLVNSWSGDASSNVCGVSDITPVEEQIKVFSAITGAKTIGNIYASGESNSIVLKNMIEAACKKFGLKLVDASVSNTAEVKTVMQSIINRVDAIYIAPDNTVNSALAAVSEVAAANRKPFFCADPTNTDNLESLIGWGFDYYSIGLEAGAMIEKILNGANAGSLGSVKLTDPAKFELHINLDNAKKLGISIPDELVKNATVVIENGKVSKKK